MQLWRGRWTLLGMLLAAAGAAAVTGLTHSRHEFIGPLRLDSPEPQSDPQPNLHPNPNPNLALTRTPPLSRPAAV